MTAPGGGLPGPDDLRAAVREVLRDELRTLIREVLRDGLPAAAAGPAPAAPAPASPVPASPVPAGPAAARPGNGTVQRIEKGAVTERAVIAAAKAGASLVLGPRAVLTPLARDKARALGVPVQKER